jgi:hypothetical protein
MVRTYLPNGVENIKAQSGVGIEGGCGLTDNAKSGRCMGMCKHTLALHLI